MSEPSKFLLRHGTPRVRGGVETRSSPRAVRSCFSEISSLSPHVFQEQLEMDYAREQGPSWGRGPPALVGALGGMRW